MEKRKAKPYDALVQFVGKVRRNARMLHILARSRGTELVLGHGAAMWMCLFGEGEATLCPVRSHCLEQLLQFPALTAQLACKNAPSPLATAPASCSVEPGWAALSSSSSWPLDPFQKQLFHLGSVDASGSVMCWGCWWHSVLCSWDCRKINAVLQLGINYLGGENHRMCGNFWAYKWDICPFSLTALWVLKGAKGAQVKSIFLQ